MSSYLQYCISEAKNVLEEIETNSASTNELVLGQSLSLVIQALEHIQAQEVTA
jgi:hypothetical protein